MAGGLELDQQADLHPTGPSPATASESRVAEALSAFFSRPLTLPILAMLRRGYAFVERRLPTVVETVITVDCSYL